MFGNIICNLLFMISFILALSTGFYIVGKFFTKLLRLPNINSASFTISVGISSLTFFSYYINKFNLSLIYFWIFLFSIAIAFLTINFKTFNLNIPSSQTNKNLLKLVFIISIYALLFSIQSMTSFRTSQIPVGTIMNFDIFYWSLLAEHIFVKTNFTNIIPGGDNILNYLYIDGWGSSLLLAFFSKILKISAIEAASYYSIFFLTLISLAIFELIQKIFHFKNSIAFILAFLTTGNTFLFFIAYNQFNSEIAATFYYLVGLFIIIYLINNTKKFLQSVLTLTFPLIGILLIYQSGFLVFSSFLILFYFISLMINQSLNQKTLSKMSYFLSIFFLAILLTMLLLPEFSLYTLRRTFVVVNVVLDGWEMPLLSPFILFSIPELGILPDTLNSQLMKYIGTISILLLLLILACKMTYRLNKTIYNESIGIVLFFGFSLSAYFVLYCIKGDAYQVWKFAGFTILPISFVFISAVISPFYYSKSNHGLHKNILFIFLTIICFFMLKYPFKNKEIYLYNDKIQQLNQIRETLHKNLTWQNIVIATENDTQMLAINLFSNKYKLYPLIKAHRFAGIPTSELIRSLDSQQSVAIVQSQCYPDIPNHFATKQFKVISLNQLYFITPTKSECIHFNNLKPLDYISSEWV